MVRYTWQEKCVRLYWLGHRMWPCQRPCPWVNLHVAIKYETVEFNVLIFISIVTEIKLDGNQWRLVPLWGRFWKCFMKPFSLTTIPWMKNVYWPAGVASGENWVPTTCLGCIGTGKGLFKLNWPLAGNVLIGMSWRVYLSFLGYNKTVPFLRQWPCSRQRFGVVGRGIAEMFCLSPATLASRFFRHHSPNRSSLQ